jgi:peptide/nickel transport system permease protein
VVAYIIRRLIALVLMLLVISMVTFAIFFLLPRLSGGDPAVLYAGKTADAKSVEGVKKKLGLDKPVPVQYGLYVKGIFFGRDYEAGGDVTHCPAPCLGYSFKTEEAVWGKLLDRLPVTASLAFGAAVLWLVGGMAVGILSALRRRTFFDRAAMMIALAGVSLPIYFTGLVALKIFSYGPEGLRWFPNVHYTPLLENPFLWARNLTLAWVTLAFLYAATYARLTRASMIETMGEDYIRTARAKGLSERAVITKHGLRAALTPIVTVFGLDLGALLGGAILTESVFGFPGLGKMSIDAINQQDLPVILGVTLLAAFFIVFANLIVDIMYAVVDPRVRYS